MRIVIGYDASSCADVAIADLRRAGLPADTEAVVLSSADLLVEVPYAGCEDRVPPEFVRQAREACRDAMGAASDAARHGADVVASAFPSWKVTSQAVADTAYWSLIEKAEQWRADLI